MIAFLFVATGGYTRYTIAYNKATEERAKQLASYALDRLSTQASMHAHDPQTYPESFISMTHLRDDVLRDEFSATRRMKLWDKVQKKVEQNSNIRPMVREGRSGDRGRVWEWIGAFRALEDSGSGRRESSRLSLGPIAGSSPAGRLTPAGEGEAKQARNWEEGRPIY
jgi:Man1-Src1p-C-terminal domain